MTSQPSMGAIIASLERTDRATGLYISSRSNKHCLFRNINETCII